MRQTVGGSGSKFGSLAGFERLRRSRNVRSPPKRDGPRRARSSRLNRARRSESSFETAPRIKSGDRGPGRARRSWGESLRPSRRRLGRSLPEQALERGRDGSAQHGDASVAVRRRPVELDDAPFAGKGLVAAPGILRPLEGDQRPPPSGGASVMTSSRLSADLKSLSRPPSRSHSGFMSIGRVRMFDSMSVWMGPFFARHWPRTVIVCSRPARSTPNLASTA